MALFKLSSKTRIVILAVLTLCLLASVALVISNKLYPRALFSFQQWKNTDKWSKKSLWLPDYRVTIEAKPIEGVGENVSALTWNPDRNTLFSVVNNPPLVLELSTEGEIIRNIPLVGVKDPEAIEYIGDNKYIIADERKQKLLKITITDDTQSIDATRSPQITVGTGIRGNQGLEGLAWDHKNKRIFVAKEKNPVRIYEVVGFPQLPNTPLNVETGVDKLRDKHLFLKDISSLDYSSEYEHLLVLSDESKLIIELDENGEPISTLSLTVGKHGLKKSIQQAEGMAVGDAETLYLVSEPNLFYVFKKIEE